MFRHLVLAAAVVALIDHPSALAAPQAGEPLRLDKAVAAALEANRLVAVAREDVEKATADLAAVRTHRLPTFSVDFLGLRTFRSVDLFFKAGALGLYPDVGPIPSADTTIPSSQSFSQLFQLRASQPITQLWEVKLRTQQLELGRELARERVDAERRAVVANVRQAYHRLLQTESAIRSSEEALTLYAEVARVVDVLVREQTVLEGDRLGVELRVAQETANKDRLGRARATLKEQLNLLMGRPLDTPFEVEALPLDEPEEFELADARARAWRDRSDLKELRLKREQAALDVRVSAADRLPDVSATVQFTGLYNVDVLPAAIGGFGVSLSWEPWDWGRRRQEVAARSSVLEQARIALLEAEAQVALEVGDRYRQMLDARATLRVADLAVPHAREQLRVANERYRQQATVFRDLLEAQTALSRAQTDQQQALDGYLVARAQFLKAIGDQP